MNLKLDLPFRYRVIGYLDACGRSFAVVECDDPDITSFASYRLEPHPTKPDTWACSHGFYTDSRSKAFTDMYQRAMG